MPEIKAPLYNAGDVHYLSHRSGAPVKIAIEAVYRKANSAEWMYCIYSESNGCSPAYVPESVLKKRISKHSGQVYQNPEIAKRLEDGFRFAGNYSKEDAVNRGREFARNKSIVSVWLHPALDSKGDPLFDQYGIWIKWSHIITDHKSADSQSVIKIK